MESPASRPAKRTVSLLPAATEIVAFLGATEQLVGITHECDYPDVVKSRARVTSSLLPHTGDPGAIDAAVRALNGAGLFCTRPTASYRACRRGESVARAEILKTLRTTHPPRIKAANTTPSLLT